VTGPVTQNHLSKPEDLMLQNATLSGNQRTDLLTSLMNMSLVLRLPHEKTTLQVLFKCTTPANVFETATKPSRFAHFWQGGRRRTEDKWNGKNRQELQKLRKPRRIASFLTLPSSKIEDVSQNSFVFQLVDRQIDRQIDK